MIIQNIPSNQIVKIAARRNKDYELEFVNSDSNSDVYSLEIFLRRCEQEENQHFKIKLILTSNILAYPALELIWVFDEDQYELASRVYHRICDEVDDVKTDFDGSMTPVSTLAAKIREAVKPISLSHRESNNQIALDEASKLSGVSDWRKSIYSNRYPNMSRKEKEEQHFNGNEVEKLGRVNYKTREKY